MYQEIQITLKGSTTVLYQYDATGRKLKEYPTG